MKNLLTRLQAVKLLEMLKVKGNFFTVAFIKRTTGELREMNCRGGVSKYVNGKGLAFDPYEKGLIGVWEANNKEGEKGKDAYRFIPIEGLKSITARGKNYLVET